MLGGTVEAYWQLLAILFIVVAVVLSSLVLYQWRARNRDARHYDLETGKIMRTFQIARNGMQGQLEDMVMELELTNEHIQQRIRAEKKQDRDMAALQRKLDSLAQTNLELSRENRLHDEPPDDAPEPPRLHPSVAGEAPRLLTSNYRSFIAEIVAAEPTSPVVTTFRSLHDDLAAALEEDILEEEEE